MEDRVIYEEEEEGILTGIVTLSLRAHDSDAELLFLSLAFILFLFPLYHFLGKYVNIGVYSYIIVKDSGD